MVVVIFDGKTLKGAGFLTEVKIMVWQYYFYCLSCEKINIWVCVVFRESTVSGQQCHLKHEGDKNTLRTEYYNVGEFVDIRFWISKDRMEFGENKGNGGNSDLIKRYA